MDFKSPQCEINTDCIGTREDDMDTGGKQNCCVNSVFYHKATNSKSQIYTCMTGALFHSGYTLKLDDYEVTMQCVESSSTMLKMSGIIVSLLISTFFT